MINDTKITLSEMIAALNRSGYLIEKRVTNMFEGHDDYRVVPNPVIIDDQTDKSREIDLFVIKSELIEVKIPKGILENHTVMDLDIGYSNPKYI